MQMKVLKQKFELNTVLLNLIKLLKEKDTLEIFLEPVDVNLVPGYTEVITHPMDFGTMETKITLNEYTNIDETKLILDIEKTE
jgi:bromodomain-containing protein 7/9